TGVVLFLLVDQSVFASLVYSYFYLWTAAAAWPPVSPVELGNAGLLTSALLVAAAFAGAGAQAGIARGRAPITLVALGALALALVGALAAEWAVLRALPIAPGAHAYGAVTAVLLVFNAVHLAVALSAAVFAAARAATRGVHPQWSLAGRVAALLAYY